MKRSGIIFRPGDYGKRGSYSEADLDAMAGDNVKIPLNLEHGPSLLDGVLGFCNRLWTAFDAAGRKVLMGEWDEPEPLAQLLGDTPRRVSIELEVATKRPVGLALTCSPAISDAALFSAVQRAYVAFSNGQPITPLSAAAQEEADYNRAVDSMAPDLRQRFNASRAIADKGRTALRAAGITPEEEELLSMTSTGCRRLEQIKRGAS